MSETAPQPAPELREEPIELRFRPFAGKGAVLELHGTLSPRMMATHLDFDGVRGLRDACDAVLRTKAS